MPTIPHETVWLGRGGQGAFTAARLLGLAAVRFAGKQALAFPSFGPERRGAPVFAYTRIDEAAIRDRSAVRRADVAVIMDETLLEQVPTDFLTPRTVTIVDSDGWAGGTSAARLPSAGPKGRFFPVPAKAVARTVLGSDHTNTVLLGVVVGLTGLLPPEAVTAGILAEFGSDLRGTRNVQAFRRGLEAGRDLLSANPLTEGLTVCHG